MLGKLYTPASFVMVVVTTPVLMFASVISVPGIRACCGSVTVPDNTALVPCARDSRTNANSRTRKVNKTRVRLTISSSNRHATAGYASSRKTPACTRFLFFEPLLLEEIYRLIEREATILESTEKK